jgi:hypothetical protein
MLSTVKKHALRYARSAGVPGTFNARAIFQDGSEQERQAFYEASIQKNLAGYCERVRLMEELDSRAVDADPNGLRLPEIPQDKGYALVRPDHFPLLDEAIAEAREAFRAYKPGTSKRERDSLEGVPREDRSYTSAINRLAMHPEVLRVVSKYIGAVPLLYRINVLYSPNNEVVEQSSQFYHLDPEDVIMSKLFIFVEDVDSATGPTTLLPADRSMELRHAITYRKGRVPDDVIERLGGAENLVEATGPAGTMAFLDTCRCFHMGSRKASKPRYTVMIQYQTPYAASFPMEGPIGSLPVGARAIPPEPTLLEQYLFGLRR